MLPYFYYGMLCEIAVEVALQLWHPKQRRQIFRFVVTSRHTPRLNSFYSHSRLHKHTEISELGLWTKHKDYLILLSFFFINNHEEVFGICATTLVYIWYTFKNRNTSFWNVVIGFLLKKKGFSKSFTKFHCPKVLIPRVICASSYNLVHNFFWRTNCNSLASSVQGNHISVNHLSMVS